MPEMRIDPVDGETYSWEAMNAYYRRTHSPAQIARYWESCQVASKGKGKGKGKGKEAGPAPKAKAKAKAKVKAKAKAEPKEERPPIELYTNGMCPFAHRAHFAAALSGCNVNITYIPLSGQVTIADKMGVDKMPLNEPFKEMTAQQVKDLKSEYMEKTNPSGEVPTIKSPKGDLIYESEICAEYLNAMSRRANLVPGDPVLAARMRLACKRFNDVIGPCYGLLMNQDPKADQEKADTIKAKLAKFAEVIDKDAKYCFGNKLTLADVHVGPFLFRFKATLTHYRGFDIFADQAMEARLKSLAENIIEHVAFHKLVPVTDEMIVAGYIGYANGNKWVDKPEGDDSSKWFSGRGRSEFGK
jgi:glutathione S-transferase